MPESTPSAVWRPITVDSTNESSVPSPRAGHTLIYNARKAECILFGGASHEDGLYNDVFRLDLASHTWTKLIQEDQTLSSAPPRYEHNASVVWRQGEGSNMIVMYGAGYEGLREDIWSLNLETYKWTELKTKGRKPSPRTILSVGYVKVKDPATGLTRDRLYVFGGGEAGDRPVPDVAVYCLDIQSLFWIQVSNPARGVSPTARLGHSFTAVGDKIFLFGGSDPTGEYDDVWVFDTTTNTWTNPMTTGEGPGGRSGHTATLVGKKLVIYGGLARNGGKQATLFEDVYVLDTDTFVWTRLETAFEPPNPPGKRLDHDTCLISSPSSDETSLLVFGGMDLENMYNDLFELRLPAAVVGGH
ncbi:hypothetical protein HDV00_005399 [Rhizophlyctis rosea]|nr:hypothetical protein HDV00_005399 [Rhizophlyctis rosea]